MATANATLTAPARDLNTSRRAEIIADLNTSLAYLVDLHVAGKQAHWNIQGPNFAGLHRLFDQVVDDARMYADTVAERIRALRGTAHGTIADAASMKEIPAFPTDMQDWEGLATAMHERVMKTSERMRTAAGKLDDELATQDVYIEVIRGLDKWAWMLESHLAGSKSARG